MTDAIQELKIRAEILQGRVQARDNGALSRLRVLPEFRKLADRDLFALAGTLAKSIKRRHCLGVVAAEMGFPDWTTAKRVLGGDGNHEDYGTLLCPTRCGVHLNHWYTRYAEAVAVREARGGYLLAYRRQYVVVDRDYIETLGLDPDDPDWMRLGYDWARPLELAARTRLYAKVLATLPRGTA